MSEESFVQNTEFEFCEEDVVVDPYNCDLNLVVDKECLLAYPLTNNGFCSLWAGCFATYGVHSGRVAFEVFLNDYIESEELPKDDQENNYAIRIGWSVKSSSLQLGEDIHSYCFANNARKATNSVFEDYGQTFDKGDSVAAYIDFETSQDKIQISFSKNGYDLGMAYEVDKSGFLNEGKNELPVFFPHVLTKNIVFEVNFGQRVSLLGDEPFAPIKSEFQMIQKFALDKRVRGSIGPKDKHECEVIMLVGLPLCGKTQFAHDLCKSHPEKCYNIIGVSTILDKMKMIGTKKKNNSNGTSVATQIAATAKLNSEAIDKAICCMNKLIELASNINRNIILDQSNVYTSTRRRKMGLFKEFKRKAVVIVQNYDEYNEQIKKLDSDEALREATTNVIYNMKASFTLPEVGEFFDTIEYIGLDEKSAKELVSKYNLEGPECRMQMILSKRAKYDEERKQNGVKGAATSQKMFRPSYGYGGKDSGRYFRPQVNTQMQYRRPAVPVQNRLQGSRMNIPVMSPVQLQNVRIHSPYNFAVPQQIVQPPIPNWNPYAQLQQQQHQQAIYNPLQPQFNPQIGWQAQQPPPNWPTVPTIPMNPYQLAQQQQQYWQQAALAQQQAWFNQSMPGQVLQIPQQLQQQQPPSQQQQSNAQNDWTPAMATNVSNTFNSNK